MLNYNNWVIHRIIKVSRKVVDFIDSFTDRRICGVSLTKFTRSSIPGATVAQATPYLVLDEIFRGGGGNN